MKKRILALMLAVIQCVSLLVLPANAAETDELKVEFTAPSEAVNPGDSVTVNVALAENPGVAGLDMVLDYDADVLTVESATNSEGTGLSWVTTNHMVGYAASNSTYEGQILTLVFKVNEGAEAGDYSIGLAVGTMIVDENEDDVAYSVTPATVKVAETAQTPDETYTPDENDAVVYQGTTFPSADGYISEIGVKDGEGIVGYTKSEAYGSNTVAVTVLMDSSKYENNTTFSTYFLTGGATPPEVEAWGEDANGEDIETLDVTMVKHNASDWYMNMETIYYMIGSKYVGVTFVPAAYTLDKTELTLEVGAEDKLSASLTYYSGPSDWESSNANVVTVDDEGNIKAVASGTATITATVGEFTASCVVTVPSSQYTPDENDAVVYQGNSFPSADGYISEIGVKDGEGIVGYTKSEAYGSNTVAVTVLMDSSKYENNTTFSTYFLTGGATPPEVEAWGEDANGEDIETLDVTMVKHNASDWYMNMETIYYMIGSKYVGVTFVPAAYTLDKTELTLEVGAEDKLSASLTYYSGPSDWESSNANVVTVDDEGNIKAVASGTATITATVGEFAATCKVVVNGPNPITEIEVKHPNIVTDEETGAKSMTMITGTSEKIDMSFAVADAELDPTQIVFWSSSEETVAAVDQNGKITAVGAGETIITAKAVNADGTATAAEGDEVLASITLTVEDPTSGYTVAMGEDVAAVVNDTISIPVTIGHTGSVKAYNAFDLTFEYDPEVLELTSTEITGMTVTVKNGKIHVERYGSDLVTNNVAFALTFKAIATAETNVKVTSAKVDISDSALTQDAPDASVLDNVTKVSISGFSVSLPTEFKGESGVLPGENYTFKAKDKNYNYTFEGSTMGGQPVSIKDNGNGTFTIENVTGNIVVVTEKTGKTFTVTLGEDMTSTAANAQYMTNYAVTLTKAEGYNYSVKVTINNVEFKNFTYDAETGLITIPGEAITGDIVFDSGKTEKTPDKHGVEFGGNAGGVTGDPEVTNGESYTFTVEKEVGYTYTVTATMNGEPVEVIDNGDGTYTIENVTGDLVINISKTYDMEVDVNQYVKLDGKVMFLVTATGSVDEGKVLAYDGTAMFWSEQYNAWSYLVITDSTLSVEDAKAQITLNEGTKVELDQTYNVNETANNTVDINDAQLVYDLYNNVYQDIETVGMQKFLKADVNGDKTINVNDAAAVVAEIVKNK